MAEKSSVWDCVVYHKLLAAVQLIWSPFFQVHYWLHNCHLDVESSQGDGVRKGVPSYNTYPMAQGWYLHSPFGLSPFHSITKDK